MCKCHLYLFHNDQSTTSFNYISTLKLPMADLSGYEKCVFKRLSCLYQCSKDVLKYLDEPFTENNPQNYDEILACKDCSETFHNKDQMKMYSSKQAKILAYVHAWLDILHVPQQHHCYTQVHKQTQIWSGEKHI